MRLEPDPVPPHRAASPQTRLRRRWLPRAIERAAFFLAGTVLASTVAFASTPDTFYRKLEVLAQVLSSVENHYVDATSPTDLVYGAARGVTSILDPHTVFFPPSEYKALLDVTEGEYAGIGIEIDVRAGKPEVIAVLDGSPAQKAGLMHGDQIIAVDESSVDGLDLDALQRRLRGPVGTKVVLTVERANNPKPWRFTLVRSWVRVAPLEHVALANGRHLVRLKTFSRRVASDLEGMIQRLGKVQGLVLDLRNNPGGLFDEAVEVCDLFLDDGAIVSTVGRGGRILEERRARKSELLAKIPMAVLIDGASASASEIVAGALQDRGRARLFGERTYGKGSVQSILDLTDGSGIKLTVARYLTPSGKMIDGYGIEPDEVVAATEEGDPALEAAMAWLGK